MSRSKLTPWFDESVKPARPGVYERNLGPIAINWYSFWNGREWKQGCCRPNNAARVTIKSHHQKAPWRGLVEPQP